MQTPYYAVIFTSTRTEGNNGYEAMATEMEALAQEQPGYIGIEHARSDIGITISYWESEEAIRNWKKNAKHLFAQQKGKEREYAFESE